MMLLNNVFQIKFNCQDLKYLIIFTVIHLVSNSMYSVFKKYMKTYTKTILWDT